MPGRTKKNYAIFTENFDKYTKYIIQFFFYQSLIRGQSVWIPPVDWAPHSNKCPAKLNRWRKKKNFTSNQRIRKQNCTYIISIFYKDCTADSL